MDDDATKPPTGSARNLPDSPPSPPTARPIPRGDGETMDQLAYAAEFFSGPYPHPDFAERYEALCPGFMRDSLEMAKAQSGHRQRIEVIDVQGKLTDQRLGKIGGVTVALAALAAATILGLHGYWIGGATIFGLDVGGMVIALVTTNAQNRAERRQDRQLVDTPPSRPPDGAHASAREEARRRRRKGKK